ncbi:NUDIX hydrolase [Tsuneonella sp. HG222]
MFHLIPPPLHRLALRIASRVRAHYRRRFRRPINGVALVARDAGGRVLLVRHTYGSRRWALPGGGRGAREDPADCVRREMREELGCDLVDLALLRVARHELQGAPITSHIFTARLSREPRVDGREIEVARWFDPADLPEEIVHISRREIERAEQAGAAER